MVNEERRLIGGAYTEGLTVRVEGLVVTIDDGSITFSQDKDKDGVIEDWEYEHYDFEGIQFSVEPDNELPVLYDIYLCGNGEIDIERIEMLPDTMPMYTGEQELLHCLCSFLVPPNAVNLDDITINFILLDFDFGYREGVAQ